MCSVYNMVKVNQKAERPRMTYTVSSGTLNLTQPNSTQPERYDNIHNELTVTAGVSFLIGKIVRLFLSSRGQILFKGDAKEISGTKPAASKREIISFGSNCRNLYDMQCKLKYKC